MGMGTGMEPGTTRGAPRRARRRTVAALAVLTAVVITSCGPPAPTPPRWTSTRLARSASATETVNHYGAWTDDQWFATVRVVTPFGSGGTSISLQVHPRTGPSGRTLGTPQVVPLTADVGAAGPVGEHVIGLGGTAPYGEPTTVHFYRPVAGVWGPAGTATLPAGFQLSAMTDRWLVARRVPGDPSFSGDGQVRVFALDTAASEVTATEVAVLGPDPAWPTALREGFGTTVSLDGDLLAVGATGVSAPTAGGVRVFRAGPGGWAPVQSLGGTTEPSAFGRALAVDDGPTVDRLVVGIQGTSVATLAVDVLADDGSGFVLEQRLDRDANLPDASNGAYFAGAVAIDGPTIAVTARTSTVASADPLHAPVTVGHVTIYRRGGTWYRETELDVFPEPYDAGVRSALPARLQLAGTHLAASVWVSPDEPPGCVFPCFVLGFEAWSLDRS